VSALYKSVAIEREPGVIEKRVIKSGKNLVVVIRRLVWRGREKVDVRFAEVVGERFVKYTKRGIRISLEEAKSLTMALMDVLGTEVRKEVEEAWSPVE